MNYQIYNTIVQVKKYKNCDSILLHHYLNNLSEESKKRFAPHSYDLRAIQDFSKGENEILAYVVKRKDTGEIIAYFVLKSTFAFHEIKRFQSYDIKLNPDRDMAFAPSIADDWQGKGLSMLLFQFILSELKGLPTRRLILWGGVQNDNTRAINFYKKTGFHAIGQFEYQGWNTDMVLDLEKD